MKILLLPNFRLLRTRLLLLTVLTLCPVFFLGLHSYLQQRKVEETLVKDRMLANSRLAATSQKYLFKQARQLLGTLTGFPFLVATTNRPAAEEAFANLKLLAPDFVNFGIIEVDGRMYCNALRTNKVISLAGRSDFQKVMRTRRFSIGNVEPDLLVSEPCLNIGYPVITNGELKRVLFASLKLSVLSAALKDVPHEEGGAVLIVDPTGQIIAQQSDPTSNALDGHSQQELIKQVLTRKQGVFEETDMDGSRRLYAITPISEGPSGDIYAVVGASRNTSFADANDALLRNFFLMGLITALALWVGWYFGQRLLVHPINTLVSTANRLAKGDLKARTGITADTNELGQIGSAFDSMAEKLEERQGQLERANEEIQRMNAALEQRVKERTAELEALNQELEAFSHSVSHDLRAPLRHLSGFADLLWQSSQSTLDEKGKRYLKMVREASARMGVLIDDLLSFARMGRKQLQTSEVDFNETVRQIIADAAPEMAQRKIEWTVSSLPKIQGDNAMLRQVWANLIQNAIKYTRGKDPAQIEIGWREEPEKGYVFFVKDNGAGFDMKYAPKLFGVFQRLHNAEEFEGTGIGLANVRRIVHRHGGRTWAEGAVGKGATIYFSLPKPLSP